MKNIKSKIIAILFLAILFLAGSSACYAGLFLEDNDSEFNQTESFRLGSGFAESDETTMAQVVATVIEAFLGLLGIIFLVLIVYAGYNWLTARGEEEKVNKAKDTLWRAIIGIIIVVGAYVITYFVLNNLPWGAGGGPGGSP